MTQLLALYTAGAQNGGFERASAGVAEDSGVARLPLPCGSRSAGRGSGTIYTISDIELASRLSFFLWSSIPDDQLLAVAEAAACPIPSVLQAQVKRMMADPRSQALVKNFAGWLFLRNIARISPDTTTFRISTRTCARRLRRKPSS